MKSQYKETSTAPKIVPGTTDDKREKKVEKQVKELEQTVREQAQLIDRMHRDIVRLRVAINEVAARIK